MLEFLSDLYLEKNMFVSMKHKMEYKLLNPLLGTLIAT